MPRVLVMQEFEVDDDDRNAIIEAARARRDIARRVGCNYWLFEEKDMDRFVQFIEAPDRKTLLNALVAIAPGHEIYPFMHEVELH